MNNYVIDPSVFYWINTLGTMHTIFAIFGWFLIAAGIGTLIAYFFCVSEIDTWGEPTRTQYIMKSKAYRKGTIILFAVGILLVLASIFIPGKQTSIEMLVARTATFDNVNWTVSQVKEIIDYIVSALKGAV